MEEPTLDGAPDAVDGPGATLLTTTGCLEVWSLRAPLRRTFRTALREVTHLRSVACAIVDADGRRGWGEAAIAEAVTGIGSDHAVAALVGPIADALEATGVDEVEAATRAVERGARDVPPAASAASCALVDLAARRAGLSAHRFLGATDDALLTSVTIAADAPDAMAADAAERAAQGFVELKLKLGGVDVTTDLDRVVTVAARVGGAVKLLLDVNQGWSHEAAAWAIPRIVDQVPSVVAVEQPFVAADLDAMAAWRERLDATAVELIADESVFGPEDAGAVLHRGAADRINVKLAKAGGLRRAREIVRLAAGYGVPCMVGCMLESPLGVTAAAALALSEGVDRCDLDAPLLLAASPVNGGAQVDAPRLVLPGAEGFACTPT